VNQNFVTTGETVTITWRLGLAGRLKLVLFNSAGEYVQTVFDADQGSVSIGTATWDQTNWRGETVASNVYVLRVTGPGISRSYKVAVER